MGHRASVAIVAIGLALGTRTAAAGKYFDPGAGLSGPVRSADCGRGMRASPDAVPAWSRLSWSLQTGAAVTRAGRAAVVVPQLGYALWLREWRCTSGTGLIGDHRWRRWSVALSLDTVARPADADLVVRPALRLARAHVTRGLLSFGSEWTASTELFVAVGPTFDPGWHGGAASVGGRVSVVAVEARLGVTRGRDVEAVVLVGVTDLHGLWSLGPRRTL